MNERTYFCIDLKSFYASVECVERGLDPMTTNLIVADPERSDKTICLAVSPAMKALGVKNRCRVFEIFKNIEYITAPPRMQKYIDYAADIYEVYLRHISKDDIYVYSIDEVFIDATRYLITRQMSAKDFAVMLMNEVSNRVGVRAACGIGTNMYLAKIALDITAKHSPDFVGILDEQSYRETLWDHKPLTDFWRIGKGSAARLAKYGITTMEGIARANEDILYKLFGVDAELLIDHAWGREPVTIADIKAYKPRTNSLTSGQVLMRDYSFDEGKLIVKEMTDALCLDMVSKKLAAESMTLYVGYSNTLHIPPAKGSTRLDRITNADCLIIPAVVRLYEQITDRNKPVRRITIVCAGVIPEDENRPLQVSLFEPETDEADLHRNRRLREAMISIKERYGKNAVFKGCDLEEAATARERNRQIGGHKSGQ